VEGLDVTNDRTLWTRDFPKEAPRFLSSRSEGNLVFSWPANSDGAKLEIKSEPGLSQRWPKLDAGSGDYFLEVVDPQTGKILGAAVVRTGKRAFQLESAESSGDWLVAADSNNRILVYSLATGEQTGILFGSRPVISSSMPWLAAENERGQLSLYDLKSLTRKEQYFSPAHWRTRISLQTIAECLCSRKIRRHIFSRFEAAKTPRCNNVLWMSGCRQRRRCA
jgi:hypothetical protein